jgi:DnaA family protein
MSAIHSQLPLVFETRNAYSFETLVAGDNELAVGIARQCAQLQGEKQMLLWSEHGHGKSHLLQACCQLAASRDRTVCYLPAHEILDVNTHALEGLEQLDLICIDDIDAMMGDRQWELALFDLINRCREQGACLILSAAHAPEQWQITLPDLSSRLQWGPVFQLKPLSDENKIVALQLRANQRGLLLQEKVAEYLLSHFPRDLFTLFERLDELDKASLVMQRKLTIPFVKEVLDS